MQNKSIARDGLKFMNGYWEMLDRESILARLKQESYFRAVQMTGCDIAPDDVVVFQEADGTNIILPIRARRSVWDKEGNFERYEYDPWIWVECNSWLPTAFHLVMRRPIHEATFIVFPDWMTMDGAVVSTEILEAILADLWQRAYAKKIRTFFAPG